MSSVIVVGGGAAGMMAAISASIAGHQVTLLEKNEKLGKKIYITGKGRCNITNNSDVENLLQNVMKNPKFLYSAFYTFDSQSMMQLLEESGLAIKTERGNRVFPKSDHSSDVIKTLQKLLKQYHVKICLNSQVTQVLWKDNVCYGVTVVINGKKQDMAGDSVIVATGGMSYPGTGSTGDGYTFAKMTGHKVIPTSPSLVPFTVREDYIPKMQGLSLKNVTLTLKKEKKVLFQEMGEMLFTHFGVSGPLVLSASSVLSGKAIEGIKATIDLKPALTQKQLDERIIRDFKTCQNSYFKNSLSKLLPSKMIPVIIALSGIYPEKPVNEITKEERHTLETLIKEFPFTIQGLRGYKEAIITRGGVSVKEIDPGTMESKKVKGLYFAGEVLDLDGRTGGYNLQIAWSTGYLAGLSIENKEEAKTERIQ